MEMYENGGGATAELFWSSPSVAKEIIPSTQLYPPVSSNIPPNVTLTSPATGAVFVATSTVNLAADATDLDGAVYKVEFFSGATKLGEDTTAPFSFAWMSVPAGLQTLRAIATDDSGLVRTSAPVSITVVAGFTSNLTLISTGAVWRYLDNGSDQGSAWTTLAFNDTGWSNGPAQLGYGDGDERTILSYGPNAAAKYITTYFRRAFTVGDPTAFTALNLRLLRDDGAVIYLNGSEIYRDNMPGGAINYLSAALVAIGGVDESTFYPSAINPGYLIPGTNVLAAEIHQANGGSSDISFDFEWTGVQSFLAPYITTQPQSQTLGEGSSASLSVTATGTAPLRYQWRFNGANLPGATNANLSFPSISATQAGPYAVVITNLGGAVTSTVATIIVSTLDSDGDGMPDAWEIAHGLKPFVNDANFDPDHDGMTNLQEFLAGTDPHDPMSVLRVDILAGALRVRFIAQSNKIYTVWSRNFADTGAWQAVTNVAASPVVRTIEVSDPAGGALQQRYFRLSTP
jgi:hypothetical protein